ncbi:MAG: hypothetical protein MJE77_43440 [Proteobacteria bacterium]|nr:hypothetical protein [Pseudomonadota bacterium]
MLRTTLLLATGIAALVVAPALASAEHGIGLGAQAMITGPVGGSVTYDAARFHIDGIVGIYDDDPGDDNAVHMGARFYYKVHEKGVSDLSVGGGLGIINEANTDLHIEGSAKIRVWLVSNVAFSTTLGIGFVIDGDEGDDDDLALTGQLNALLGITYFFE